MVHSYAGMLAPDVTVRAAGRVARVVYLDAYLPQAGKACRDYLPAEVMALLDQRTRLQGGGLAHPAAPAGDLGGHRP